MAFQKVVDTAEIVIQYTGNGQTMINTLYAEKPGGYTLADLTALAVVVDANVTAAWLPDQTQDVAYVSTTVRGLAFENDQEAIVTTGAASGGALVEGLPNSVTIAIKKTSGQTGRSARGRCYWIGIPGIELQTDENQVKSAYVALVVGNMNSMRGSIDGTVWNPVLVSRFTGGAARSEGKTFPWLSNVAVNEFVDNQRGRLTGR